MANIITAGNATNSGTNISSDTSGTLDIKTGTGSGTTALSVDASQNVGIGTSSPPPGSRLSIVGGGTQISGGTTSQEGIRIQRASGYASIIGINNDNNAYNPIAFFTGTTEAARIDSSGNFLFNSGYGSVATAYGCRAWVNFNGTGTVAIRASGNVSSITDNGMGDYTVNFTTAMPDANYSTVAMNNAQTYTSIKSATTPTTSAVNLIIGGASDASFMNVAIFR